MSYAVYGRRRSDGCWKLLAPEVILKRKSFLFFKWNTREIKRAIFAKEDAVQLSKYFWEIGIYQDVCIYRDNYDPEGYFYLCASVIWKNGKWCDRPSIHSNAYWGIDDADLVT